MRLTSAVVWTLVLGSAVGLPSGAAAQTAFVRCRRPSAAWSPLQTRLRYTTMIVLPDDEEILDVVCGDKDFWVISAAQNIAHIKPAKAGAETNVNLVTTTGNIYSFVVTERRGPPDLKVYVRGSEAGRKGKPRFYSAGLDPVSWTSSERWIRCPDRWQTPPKRRPRRQFDDEFKAQAVRLVLDEGKTVGARRARPRSDRVGAARVGRARARRSQRVARPA